MGNLLKLFLIFWTLFAPIDCAKIIVLQPMTSKSQKNVFRLIVHELAARGHEVTWVYCFPENQVVPNVKTIEFNYTIRIDEIAQKEYLKNNIHLVLRSMLNEVNRAVERFVDHSEIQTLMENGKQYDIAIVNAFVNEIALMVSTHLAKHVISLSPAHVPVYSKGSPPFPLAAISSPTEASPTPENFFNRLKNVAIVVAMWNFVSYVTYGIANDLGQKKYPYLPSVSEAMDQVALYLTNVDLVMNDARPGAPNHVDIGGISCTPAKPLPKEFSEFIDSSGEDGFIFFSLGSVIQPQFIPESARLAFVKAFARLKQKVIWKFEEEMENVPDNVMLTTWAPQQDLLGHPKIRLFMTHGGILSSQETIYHGVPVIGIPAVGDHNRITEILREFGVGEKLDIYNISSDIVYSTIQKMLQDSSYKINMEKYSSIMRDQAQNSLRQTIYWIEYLIRHEGAEHLAPLSIHLNNYQYHCLDIIAILLFLILFTIYLWCKIIKFIIRKFSTAKRVKQE